MKENRAFLELMKHICERPGMFTGGSVKETLAFIDGLRYSGETPVSGKGFDRYICVRNSFPSNYTWSYVIETCAINDKHAFRLIEEMIIEFVQLKERMSADEMIEFAQHQSAKENEPYKELISIFSRFEKALLEGNEELCKQLVVQGDSIDRLFDQFYPNEITSMLEDISSSQMVKCIPCTDHQNKVRIISFGWPFPIEMLLDGDEWKVNPDKIIELWKRD